MYVKKLWCIVGICKGSKDNQTFNNNTQNPSVLVMMI